jgi:hypothetical protein
VAKYSLISQQFLSVVNRENDKVLQVNKYLVDMFSAKLYQTLMYHTNDTWFTIYRQKLFRTAERRFTKITTTLNCLDEGNSFLYLGDILSDEIKTLLIPLLIALFSLTLEERNRQIQDNNIYNGFAFMCLDSMRRYPNAFDKYNLYFIVELVLQVIYI